MWFILFLLSPKIPFKFSNLGAIHFFDKNDSHTNKNSHAIQIISLCLKNWGIDDWYSCWSKHTGVLDTIHVTSRTPAVTPWSQEDNCCEESSLACHFGSSRLASVDPEKQTIFSPTKSQTYSPHRYSDSTRVSIRSVGV